MPPPSSSAARTRSTARSAWAQLQALVSRLQQAMKASGVGVGDRVAAMLPNIPEAIAAMLAATSLGAIWSSCSPDFGERGVLDRFGQIEPKLFITVDGYWYNGKAVRILDKLKSIVAQLGSAATVVVVPYLGDAEAVAQELPRAVALEDYLKPFAPRPIAYERLAVRSSGLHSLFLRHDRRTQMHRARRRRHASAAPQGASAPVRPARRRAAVLLHHARLDDVELEAYPHSRGLR